ncbi:MAG: hypothetical protein K6C33_04090 [Desulfovibrio sp.]|jgi:hypothetical protein|nr:hypothetical protein [Desulfovibrio sp.]MBQ2516488.1 hypothetical protein [Desulfovibrio sp.]MCR5169628.1 hypothetical protein [Desulfovibrio sp.]
MDDHVTKYILKFRRDPDLPLPLVHGVFGGVNPMGEIELNFFAESEDLPDRVERLVSNADGAVLNEEIISGDPEARHVTRTIVSRIVVTYATAQAIRTWLDEQIKVMEDIAAGADIPFFGDPSSGPKQ